jgi:hypothetical protein
VIAVVHPDAAACLARAAEYLAATVFENSVAVGVLHRARARPDRFRRGVFAATIEDGGRVVGVAVQTPPWPLLVSPGPEGVPALVAALGDRRVELAMSDEATIGALAAALGARVGATLRQRFYVLRERPAATTAPGAMRLMEPRDRALALAWMEAFERFIGDSRSAEERAEAMDASIA